VFQQDFLVFVVQLIKEAAVISLRFGQLEIKTSRLQERLTLFHSAGIVPLIELKQENEK
jgi:hypothetical protein